MQDAGLQTYLRALDIKFVLPNEKLLRHETSPGTKLKGSRITAPIYVQKKVVL